MSSPPSAEPAPGAPIPGFKVAYPMVSADRHRTGFNGVELGRSQVYGAVADAVCIFGTRHRPPSKRCDCGFYCVHTLAGARDLAAEPRYRHSVVLEILGSGRWMSYERGLRYARQTVRTVRVPPCDCGRTATRFVAVVDHPVGPWRRLRATCPSCRDGTDPRGVTVDLAEFGRRCDGIAVVADPGVQRPPDAGPADGPAFGADPGAGEAGEVALLRAELTLLQARLDALQERLDRLLGPTD